MIFILNIMQHLLNETEGLSDFCLTNININLTGRTETGNKTGKNLWVFPAKRKDACFALYDRSTLTFTDTILDIHITLPQHPAWLHYTASR